MPEQPKCRVGNLPELIRYAEWHELAVLQHLGISCNKLFLNYNASHSPVTIATSNLKISIKQTYNKEGDCIQNVIPSINCNTTQHYYIELNWENIR